MKPSNPELKRMLDLYRQAQSPHAADGESVWRGVQAEISGAGAPPTQDRARPSSAAPPSGAGAKLIVLSGVIALGAGLWFATTRGERAHSPRPLAAMTVTANESAAAPPVAESPPTAVPAERTEPARASEPAPAARSSALEREAASARLASSSLAEELKLVTAAQAALDSGRHEEALALLQQHARRFPHGALAEEREAGRVEALCGLGREREAMRAAERFVSRFPGSPRSSRVRAACAQGEP